MKQEKQNYNLDAWDLQFDNLINITDDITNDVNDYLLDFFKSSFETKSFNGNTWKQSRMNTNTLIESGDLKKSIKTISKKDGEIHIQSGLPYSAIHNEGGTIRITDKMRKFFWSKYYETNKDAWKYMALTKKKYITIDQRQFIGIPNNLVTSINEIIKKHLN